MKDYIKNSITVYSIFFMSFSFFVFSCHSVEEKSDGAYEEAKASKEFSDDSLEMETEPELAPLLATKPMRVVVVDSWTNYAKEIEREIKGNENQISDLRIASGSNAKEFKKIASLEKSNQDLHNKLIEFKRNMDSEMEKFKSEMKLDLIDLEDELIELSDESDSK